MSTSFWKQLDIEAAAVWVEFGLSRSEKARNQLAEIYQPIVREIASKMARKSGFRGLYDDLVQNGYFGLVKAIEAFDPARQVKFGSFASTPIWTAMVDEMRKSDRWRRSELNQKTKGTRMLSLESEKDSETGELKAMQLHSKPPFIPFQIQRERLADCFRIFSSDRIRQVLFASFFDGLMNIEIAERFSMHPTRVSQILNNSIREIRRRELAA